MYVMLAGWVISVYHPLSYFNFPDQMSFLLSLLRYILEKQNIFFSAPTQERLLKCYLYLVIGIKVQSFKSIGQF